MHILFWVVFLPSRVITDSSFPLNDAARLVLVFSDVKGGGGAVTFGLGDCCLPASTGATVEGLLRVKRRPSRDISELKKKDFSSTSLILILFYFRTESIEGGAIIGRCQSRLVLEYV